MKALAENEVSIFMSPVPPLIVNGKRTFGFVTTSSTEWSFGTPVSSEFNHKAKSLEYHILDLYCKKNPIKNFIDNGNNWPDYEILSQDDQTFFLEITEAIDPGYLQLYKLRGFYFKRFDELLQPLILGQTGFKLTITDCSKALCTSEKEFEEIKFSLLLPIEAALSNWNGVEHNQTLRTRKGQLHFIISPLKDRPSYLEILDGGYLITPLDRFAKMESIKQYIVDNMVEGSFSNEALLSDVFRAVLNKYIKSTKHPISDKKNKLLVFQMYFVFDWINWTDENDPVIKDLITISEQINHRYDEVLFMSIAEPEIIRVIWKRS